MEKLFFSILQDVARLTTQFATNGLKSGEAHSLSLTSLQDGEIGKREPYPLKPPTPLYLVPLYRGNIDKRERLISLQVPSAPSEIKSETGSNIESCEIVSFILFLYPRNILALEEVKQPIGLYTYSTMRQYRILNSEFCH